MDSNKKFRATLHAGRTHFQNGKSTGKVYSNKHNDRNFNTDNASHIKTSSVERNQYYIADESGTIVSKPPEVTFADWEAKMYEHYFASWLQKQNERHIENRHSERIRTMSDVLNSARQAPREEILQIGNFSNRCNNEGAFIEVIKEYVEELKKKYKNIRVLDYSIHRDEKSEIHSHLRICFVHENTDGDFEPNQTKALAFMGIDAPDPDKKIDRWNNAMITFTAQCRALYVSIAQKHGFEIETIPETPGKRTLNKQEYLTKALEKQTQARQAEKKELAAEAAIIAAERDSLAEQVDALKEEQGRLKGVLRRLKAIFTPVSELFTKLAHIHLWGDKTVLDAVMEDGRCGGIIDALEELEEENLEI